MEDEYADIDFDENIAVGPLFEDEENVNECVIDEEELESEYEEENDDDPTTLQAIPCLVFVDEESYQVVVAQDDEPRKPKKKSRKRKIDVTFASSKCSKVYLSEKWFTFTF